MEFVEEMAEILCDKVCGLISGKTEEEAFDICCSCPLDKHITHLANNTEEIKNEKHIKRSK